MDLHGALALARELVDEHGLRGWRVRLDRAKTRAGACHYGTREISLSQHLTRLHDVDEVRNTILHEIAHALVGPRHGHDAVWRAKALALGCSGERCLESDAPVVKAPWQGRCPGGHVVHRHRRPSRVLACAMCPGPFESKILDWTYHGRRVPMHPNFIAELEALRTPGPAKESLRAFQPGDVVRVTAPGEFFGLRGWVVKRGRTRYHIRVFAGVLTVPFALVEAA